MAGEVLVKLPIEAGWRLLKQMDAAGLDITVAYWRYIEEHDDWFLILSSPNVFTQGALPTVRVIQHLLDEMTSEEKGDLSLQNLMVVNPYLLEIENLRARYGSVTEGRGRLIRRLSLSQSEPFIYRLT